MFDQFRSESGHFKVKEVELEDSWKNNIRRSDVTFQKVLQII